MFNNCHEDPLKRETSMAKAIKDMKAVSRDELHASLGHATYAISPIAEGTAKVLSGYFDGRQLHRDGRSLAQDPDKQIDAALGADLAPTTSCSARFSWPEQIEKGSRTASWPSASRGEAADKLWRARRSELVAEFGEDEEARVRSRRRRPGRRAARR